MIYIVFWFVVFRVIMEVISDVYKSVKTYDTYLNMTASIIGVIIYLLTITYFLYKVYPVLQFIK